MNSTFNILITGGSGFVGYWMNVTQPNGLNCRYLNSNAYNSDWEQEHYDIIVHLAPISPERVVEYSLKNKSELIYASSGAVYELQSEYADNKRKWEKECINSNVDLVIARLFTFIGSHLTIDHAIVRFIENAKKGLPINIWGNGDTIRSYLYGEDLGKWMWKLVLGGNGIYDVGSIIPYTMLETAQIVCSLIPSKIEFELDKISPKPVYLPKTYRAQKELECIETIGLREAIYRSINESI
jgi:nucleoside-diphosphate-sugar epimerase